MNFRCTVCRRRNDSYIKRLTPVASSASEFRRGQERVAPAPVQARPVYVRPVQGRPVQGRPVQYQPAQSQPQPQPGATQYSRPQYNPNYRRPYYGNNNNNYRPTDNRGSANRVRRPREDTYSP